ncbi:MAG TPA: ATP-dependent DNA ligase [Gemmatimonadales bacterium]|nr:ATP-dependent DNA ligase [Gemmatimonadales bacterium]
MRAFARLYAAIDETNATNEKVAALVAYFRSVPAADAAWAVHFLSGRRPKRLIASRKLAAWASAEAKLPEWLFEESYQAVGDLAETITLILPDTGSSSDVPLSEWVEQRLIPLRDEEEDVQREVMVRSWRELDRRERFVWNKLITGSFRVGASQRLVVRALAEVSGLDEGVVAHRLMGAWDPTADFFQRLIAPDTGDADVSRPYPFFLAYPLEQDPAALGDVGDWLAEWKWDGIRSQLIRRAGKTFLWSRGEELLAGRFPEVEELGTFLPDGTVIDGELLPWVDGKPLPFAQLQRRIGRKNLGRQILDEVPVVLVAYDLLEQGGEDIRMRPLRERRSFLSRLIEAVPSSGRLLLSPLVPVDTWAAVTRARRSAREMGAEGLLLKRLSSPYRVGRRRGDWWKWKVDPLSVEAVLIYAQGGSGRHAGLFTDYTFGIWDGDHLVPFAKAYSGLTDDEMRRVDQFIRRNTLERFGPVRTVKPELVFELHFEGIQPSTRHKSGIAVRFPRMARWRRDKKAEDADTIETVKSLIRSVPSITTDAADRISP